MTDLSKQAPAQDEREAFEKAFVIQEGVYWSEDHQSYRSMNGRAIEERDAIDATMYWVGWMSRAELTARPAQTTLIPERKPMGWQCEQGIYPADGWNAALDEVARMNPAPIAQTAPQPEQESTND
jgi:hypothetical protein